MLRMSPDEMQMTRDLQAFFRLPNLTETIRYVVRSAWAGVRIFKTARRFQGKLGKKHANSSDAKEALSAE